MKKIALAAAAAAVAFTAAPLSFGAAPAMAEGLKVAQADVYVGGRDRDDRYYRERRNEGVTVGVGPGGVAVGPRHCRTITTRVESDSGRMITRRERRCD